MTVGFVAVFGTFGPLAAPAAYAVASLGCTIGPFLAVVVGGFRAGSAFSGVGLFVAYALGPVAGLPASARGRSRRRPSRCSS